MGSPSHRPQGAGSPVHPQQAARIIGLALVPLAAVAVVSGCGHGSHHDSASAAGGRASSTSASSNAASSASTPPPASSASRTAPDELADPAALANAGESTVADRAGNGSTTVALTALSAPAGHLIVRWSCSSVGPLDTLTLSYSDGRTSSSPCDADTASAVLSADLPLANGARPTAVTIAAKASTHWRLAVTERA
jgi:hypothetical protein